MTFEVEQQVLRVAQWTTGNVAAEVVRALTSRPDIAVVGAYVRSPEKARVDLGTLCGLGTHFDVSRLGWSQFEPSRGATSS